MSVRVYELQKKRVFVPDLYHSVPVYKDYDVYEKRARESPRKQQQVQG